VNGDARDGKLTLSMAARREAFGAASQGAAFNVYSYRAADEMDTRAYAVRAGDTLTDTIPISGTYRVRVDGPNGFMREFTGGDAGDLSIVVDHAGGRAASGAMEIRLSNQGSTGHDVEIHDESYGTAVRRLNLNRQSRASATMSTDATHGWYDFTVRVAGLAYRYAGRIETGKWTTTDPAMGEKA
jgi:phospholipase C